MADPWPDVDDFAFTGKKDDDEKKKDDFIAAMAKCWVETDKGKALWLLDHDGDWKDIQDKIKGKKATVDDVTSHLDASFDKDTGAFPKAKPAAIAKAWMIARIEEYRFHQAGYRRYGNFWPSFEPAKPKARETTDVPDAIKMPGTIKIAAGLATFLTALNKKYGKFQASNYRGHSTGAGHIDQGMSVDIYLPKKSSDGLWWDVGEAVKFMKAVEDLAGSSDFKGTKWMALYDDFDVAEQINKSAKLGTMRLRASGSTYHGPDPAKLHIHLEVITPDDAAAPK
jgi:hypothetical protein